MVRQWLISTVGPKPACICLAMAVVGRRIEQRAVENNVFAREWFDQVRVESDVRATLAGAPLLDDK